MDVIFHFFKKVISLAVFMSFLIGFFWKLQQFALCKEIPEIFASRIWNPGILSGEIWGSYRVKSGIQLKESRIPLTTGIRNPSSTDKQSGILLRLWETAHLLLL